MAPALSFAAAVGLLSFFGAPSPGSGQAAPRAVVIAGDLDGDGVLDELVSRTADLMSEVGEVVAVSGADGRRLATFVGAVPGDLFGHAMIGIPDTSGDGLDDVIIGAPGAIDARGRKQGQVYVFTGPFSDDTVIDVTDAARTLESAFENDVWFGADLGRLYDWDADDTSDLRVASWWFDPDDASVGHRVTQIRSGVDGSVLDVLMGDGGQSLWTALRADLDGDLEITTEDLTWITGAIGLVPSRFDLNGDGTTDGSDLGSIVDALGRKSPPPPRASFFNDVLYGRDRPCVTGIYVGGRCIQINPGSPPPSPPPCGGCGPTWTNPYAPNWTGGGGTGGGGDDDDDPGGNNCVLTIGGCVMPIEQVNEVCLGTTVCLRVTQQSGEPCTPIWDDPGGVIACAVDFDGNCLEDPGDITANSITVKFLNFGSATIRVRKCDGCDDAVRFDVVGVDVDIDSDNDNGLMTSDYDEEEDLEETEDPGKLVFLNESDSDADDIPDFADWESSSKFTPFRVQISPSTSLEDHILRFIYRASDPSEVEAEPQVYSSTFQWIDYEAPTGFRIWTEDGDQPRIPTDLSDGGHFVAGGIDYPLELFDLDFGRVNLYIEAVGDGGASDLLTVALVNIEDPEALVCVDAVRVTPVEILAMDVRDWKPQISDQMQVLLDDPWKSTAEVDGALADGASMCVVRTSPQFQEYMPSELEDGVAQSNWTIRIAPRGYVDSVSWPHEVVGNMYNVIDWVMDIPEPMPRPLPQVPRLEANTLWFQSFSGFGKGHALYVPPEDYADATHTPGDWTLPQTEMADLEFQVLWQDQIVGRRPFILRRPPLMLVHGLNSSPAAWSQSQYRELPGNPVPTRIYHVDYSDTALLGYAENFPILAKSIERALREYRRGGPEDPGTHSRPLRGLRFAATRVDVIGHSMGGQIARLYASSLNGTVNRGGAWPPADCSRSAGPPWDENLEATFEYDDNGRYPYLNTANYAAGSIRRLVTLGSPFRGSPVANAVAGHFEPTIERMEALYEWAEDDMPPDLRQKLFPLFPDASYLAPTALADLSVNSPMQNQLDSMAYPVWPAPVRWLPMAGVVLGEDQAFLAAVNSFFDVFIASTDTLYSTLLSIAPGHIPDGFSPLDLTAIDAATSDMIVTEESQFNGVASPLRYQWHTHSVYTDLLPLKGENHSEAMATHIRYLLSTHRTGVTLPAQPPWIPEDIPNVSFMRLGIDQ